MKGIREQIELSSRWKKGKDFTPEPIPQNLMRATDIFSASEFIKEEFGEEVQKSYASHFYNEIKIFEKRVTDWERQKYFDII